MSTVLRCPICGQMFDLALSKALPFCGDRCRQIDLGRWLRESYSVTVIRTDVDEEGEDGPVRLDDEG